MAKYEIDGSLFADMIRGGAQNLRANAQAVNDLNVFPIPDGDTGDNMCMTMEGGDAALRGVASDTLSFIAEKFANGALLGARGNSGVILSQFFAGLATGLVDRERADATAMANAFGEGVRRAYNAVLTPTEGTILTVAREATDYAVARLRPDTSLEAFFSDILAGMRDSLTHTPELLPILKEAGVIDSGGAGLVYILEGMYKILCGEAVASAPAPAVQGPATPDLSLFTADSVMTFGYCTECLLQLQNSKVDAENFPVETISDFLTTVGDSIVAVKSGTVVKIHVHTLTPGKVFEFCQQFGEFLTVKVENMTLQHSEAQAEKKESEDAVQPHKPFAVVTVAQGEGICETFRSLGADFVIRGGQTMNPSAEDFLHAFRTVNADTVFVLPNNSNIVLAAQQSAKLCDFADIRVLESKTVGEGYAALTMADMEIGDADAIAQTMRDAMQGVVTAQITRAVRDTSLNGVEIVKNDFIGFAGKQMLADAPTVRATAEALLSRLDFEDHEVVIVLCGKEATAEDMDAVRAFLRTNHPRVEIFEIDGGQELYPFIFILE
ncbi:MAG: DAK2 domain-containing protein [Clostridia bacterium]|nr:DAK2 domain-containing protein [Clostridia bacterium]